MTVPHVFEIIRRVDCTEDGFPTPSSSFAAFGPFQNWLSENCTHPYDVTIFTPEFDSPRPGWGFISIEMTLTVVFQSVDDYALCRLRWQ